MTTFKHWEYYWYIAYPLLFAYSICMFFLFLWSKASSNLKNETKGYNWRCDQEGLNKCLICYLTRRVTSEGRPFCGVISSSFNLILVYEIHQWLFFYWMLWLTKLPFLSKFDFEMVIYLAKLLTAVRLICRPYFNNNNNYLLHMKFKCHQRITNPRKLQNSTIITSTK